MFNKDISVHSPSDVYWFSIKSDKHTGIGLSIMVHSSCMYVESQYQTNHFVFIIVEPLIIIKKSIKNMYNIIDTEGSSQ